MVTSINLKKGERADIKLPSFIIGLGWDPNQQGRGEEYDLDASAFCLNASGKCPDSSWLVYYNNLTSPNEAISHTGDVRDGEALGDDESMQIDLAKLPTQIEQIIISVTIHEAAERGQNFGQIRNSFIRIYDAANQTEICKYELDEDFSAATSIEFGRLYKRAGAWRFEALGIAHKGGLQELVNKYL